MKRWSWRSLLYWLGPTAAGPLTGQQEMPAAVSSVVVDTLAGLSSEYLAQVPVVRVFLPPGYQPGGRYPILLANDGQDMEAVGLAATLSGLVESGSITPLIVVAVHAGPDRLLIYGTSGQTNAQGLGRRAGDYERFLLDELLPLVARRYPNAAPRPYLMGWSLGGLSAFDIAWRNGNRVAGAGVFSGALWWRSDDSSVATRQSSRIVHRRVREAPTVPRIRVWFEAGREDETADRDGNGVIDAIQDTRELIAELEARGLREGETVAYYEVAGGHDTRTWGAALPAFLRWAFGAPPDP